ncbi:MAG: D-alanyl-D-alanine endopeptidase, partial [Neisseriaceae bacterium]
LANGRRLMYNNTNSLVKDDDWQIGLQKTGFINEAGKCVVMQATIANTPLVIVLLDSDGKYQRLADANRIKRWIESGGGYKLLFAKG